MKPPSVAVTFAKGLGVVGSSPLLLVTTFLAVLALWLAFTAFGAGVGSSPTAMVQFLALPPIHSFLDLSFLQTSREPGTVIVPFAIGLLVIRAVTITFWIASIEGSFPGTRSWREVVAVAARRTLSSAWVVAVLEFGYIALTLLALTVLPALIGPQFFIVGLLAWLFGGLYLLVYVEVVAVVEGLRPRQSLQLGMRVPRVPGGGQALVIVPYLILAVGLTSIQPGGSLVVAATPSVTVWVYVLFVSFVHTATLGAFTFRWLWFRDAVKAGAGARTPRGAGRPRLFPMLRPPGR